MPRAKRRGPSRKATSLPRLGLSLLDYHSVLIAKPHPRGYQQHEAFKTREEFDQFIADNLPTIEAHRARRVRQPTADMKQARQKWIHSTWRSIP